jgi:hypothetical protein
MSVNTYLKTRYSYSSLFGRNYWMKEKNPDILEVIIPMPIVFKERRDTRTFFNLKSTHCTLLIWLIINLETKKVCIYVEGYVFSIL